VCLLPPSILYVALEIPKVTRLCKMICLLDLCVRFSGQRITGWLIPVHVPVFIAIETCYTT